MLLSSPRRRGPITTKPSILTARAPVAMTRCMGPRLRGDDSNRQFATAGIVMAYFVYILASRRHGTLYIGITNDLRTRLEQHRLGLGSEFVRQYKVHRLVYVETYENAEDAIRREKQLKKWNRDWKIRLIEEDNLEWKDLSHLIT
jgi:putative endonuclease